MEAASLLASLVLAGVFAVSGIAKLADMPGSRQAMRDFGVPGGAAPLAGVLLPLVELALALALVPVITAPWAATGAFALLALFSASIAINLARGKRPRCHCFGTLSAAPIGPSTLARNAALAALAAFILWDGRTPRAVAAAGPLFALPAWVPLLVGWSTLLTIVVLAQGWLLLHLLRQHGRLLARLDQAVLGASIATGSASAEGLPLHTPAPALSFETLGGQQTTLGDLLGDNRPALLLFIDPHCGPCNELLPEARTWRQQFAHLFHVVAISRGTASDNREKTRGLAHVWLQPHDEALGAFRIAGTPSAIVVAPTGYIASQTAAGADAIRNLVSATASAMTRARAAETTPSIGAVGTQEETHAR